MWRYQRPQFGALVLAELQRQQSCSQFCDTVLKADGVSVPAHSCILAALSPQLSCALSALPSPPSGQQHLLEFRTFRACSLLRLVGLLYSGEMVGEGEMERQEMVTAAARLGIQGLVEVGPRDEEEEDSAQQLSRKACQSSVEESQSRVVLQRDVGVQTDTPQCPGAQNMTEGGTRGRRQKRGREALTMRLRKRLNIAEIPRGTGDSELIGSNMAAAGAPNRSVSPEPTGSARLEAALTVIDRPAPLSVSHQTQASGVVVPGTLSMPLPYIPLSQLLYCPPGGNHSHNKPPPSVLIPCGESAAVYVLPPSMSSVSLSASGTGHVSEALPPFTSDPQHAWRAWPTAEGGLEQDGSGEAEGFERFEGNIAGFINHFLDPAQPQGESTRGRRGRRGRRSLAGGARRGGTERRARRPRRGVRARGGVEKHGSEIELAATEVSRRVRLWSGGIQDCRIGRGGGVVGRKLCLKPRELIQPIKICLKRRGQSQKWEITGVKERGGASRCSRKRGRGQRKRGPKLSPDGFPVIKRQRSPLQLLPFPALPLPLYQALTYDPPSPSTPPASPPALAHYTAPAPALLHTAPLPPLEPPPQEDSAEQFDRLLEDIMDLDFSCRGCQDAGRGVVIAAPSNVDAVTELTGRVDSSEVLLNHGAPTCGGELTDILDHFLRSFEHQVAALNQAAVNQTSACLLEPDPSTTSCNGAWPSASDSIPATPVRAELMKILPVNQPISSAEEMKAQTTTQPAGESVMKSQTLSPNSPMRSPEKLTSQSGQPFRTRVEETPICEEQVAQKSGDDSGMEGMAEEEDLHVTQRANPLTCQDVSEALQTQSSRMESEGTPEEMEKPEEGEDLEDVGAVEEDSDRSVDVVGEDGEVWLKSDSAENPYTQSENRAMGKVPVQERSVNLAVARPSQSRRELEVEGSTGSREEEEEEVDVLGGFSPSDVLPVILPGSWGEGLNSDEEEEEIDVIGGQFDHTPFIGPWV
ncbi:hypothetical protein UPYG_G00216910 [Umbra pygmaea]|uniref:BTB domain-containing protein n=1 Tax=Umbra pygmaea TaxID=75934 RepID=A0ABD0WKY6_UMBPY